jgi:hypothetical protein
VYTHGDQPCTSLAAHLPLSILASAAGPARAGLTHLGPAHRPSANLTPAIAGVAVNRCLAGDISRRDDDPQTHLRRWRAEKRALSQSLGSDRPGYRAGARDPGARRGSLRNGPDANGQRRVNANPAIDRVPSIDGNDVLAAKPDGWYKAGSRRPGSEAASIAFATTPSPSSTPPRRPPDLRVVLSSYDYPNFNTGLFCGFYACPKREDLSRDPVNDPITDPELNGMMVTVESQRIGWTLAATRVDYDNAVGLMHYFYGDGVSGPLVLPRPGTIPPDYDPFPGGNPLRPTLRANFRVSYDPIHPDRDGHEYKIVQRRNRSFFLISGKGGPADVLLLGEPGWVDGWRHRGHDRDPDRGHRPRPCPRHHLLRHLRAPRRRDRDRGPLLSHSDFPRGHQPLLLRRSRVAAGGRDLGKLRRPPGGSVGCLRPRRRKLRFAMGPRPRTAMRSGWVDAAAGGDQPNRTRFRLFHSLAGPGPMP